MYFRRRPTSPTLPSFASQSTEDVYRRATDSERAEIVEAAHQDAAAVLLHPTEAGDPYYIGDIYETRPDIALEWAAEDRSDRPYLQHVQELSKIRPHLLYLADFMEVGTVPLRWKFITKNSPHHKVRLTRTKVARIDFLQDGKITSKTFDDISRLRRNLSEPEGESRESEPRFCLFVVEDLSSSVIEVFGDTYGIDPSFFRAHIHDYAWYNVRDRFYDPPQLDIVAKQQDWFQLRWVRARYFKTRQSFETARVEANRFNVFRRPDDDLSNTAILDENNATVGLVRTRASFWMNSNHAKRGTPTGILLLDPTIQEGFPVWQNYRNWVHPPGMATSQAETPSTSPKASLFDDVVYWTSNEYLPSPHPRHSDEPFIPIQAFLHLVCADWLTIISYISTRLGQLEWEISFPEEFQRDDVADVSLTKLHVWRRLVPLYNEMLQETLDTVFQYPFALNSSTGPRSGSQPPPLQQSDALERTSKPVPLGQGECPGPALNRRSHLHNDLMPKEQTPPAFYALQPWFSHAIRKMQGFQTRLGRLTNIATAAISIAETRLSYDQNRNISRLSWLALIYIPLTFVTGLFSIQSDIPSLVRSFQYFFVVAIPLGLVTLAVATLMNSRKWKTLWGSLSCWLEGKEKLPTGKFVFYGKDGRRQKKS